jgi:signal transduction histidine kinase
VVERRLPPAIEVLLFRVTQEALTNMVKHARARHAWVELALDAAGVTLSIRDDGIGFDVDGLRRKRGADRGLGLLGMRERVAYHHGWIDIRSRPGDGVRITLGIPIGGDDDSATWRPCDAAWRVCLEPAPAPPRRGASARHAS